ncbi:hypothetical protein LTR86_002856 [Recurvomyces mirabilis]|nr:hypothetical protein LTR86_002856 [Recurvomyces mirabilis]
MGSVVSKPSTPLEYPGGTYVLIVSWRNDGRNGESAMLMGRAWEERQANVTYIDDGNYTDPVEGEEEKVTVREAMWDWYVRSDQANMEAHKRLLVLCFFGHGKIVRPKSSPTEAALWGSSADGKHTFDMTDIAQSMRSLCHSDVLFVLECCSAGHLGVWDLWEIDRENHCYNWGMKMEVLAAGPETIYTGSKELDFSWRLRRELRKRGRQYVMEIFHKILNWELADAPGYYRQFSGNGSIVLDDLWREEEREEQVELEEEQESEQQAEPEEQQESEQP